MGTVSTLMVQNYRSIGERITLRFPAKVPIVLVGDNNAGKSNLVKALDLVLGESWPGSYSTVDHDFHERSSV